jgi:hypothetical protein
MSEQLAQLLHLNNQFVGLARKAVIDSESSDLLPFEVESIGSMTDEVELLGYLMDRREAEKTKTYGEFLLRYYPQEKLA